MKKQFTLISGFVLVAGAAVAQMNLPTRQLKPQSIELPGESVKNPTGVTKAGGDVIWQDDFSGTNTWDIATSGQGTFVIGTMANWGTGSTYIGNMASTTAANGFAFFNGVQYLLDASAAAQNTSVTSEAIDLTGVQSINISFQQRYRAFNTDVTYVEFSEDGGTTWTVSEMVNVDLATNAPAVQNTISIDIPVSGTANSKIRFRWENPVDDVQFGSGYGWMVDDVVVSEGYGNNASLLYTYSAVGAELLQYSKIPVGQTASAGNTSFGAEVKNVGYNTLPLELHVTSGAYNQTGAPIDVLPFTVDSLEILMASGMPMPTVVGVSNYTFEITSDSTLATTSDDSRVVGFEVTPYVYAVDRFDGTAASMTGQFTGWASGTGDPGIGTMFEVFTAGEIGSIDVGIANISASQQTTYNGREFFAQIYQYDAGLDEFVYLSETPTTILAATHYGKLVKLKMPTATISVTPGLYLAVARSFASAEVPFAFAGVAPAGTTLGFDGADLISLASDDATPNIVDAPMVRLDFQSYVGLNEIENVTEMSVAPNPFTNSTEINFELKDNADISISVTDLSGRTVISIPATNYNAGAQTISLNGSALNSGVYNCVLTVGNNKITKRIVKN